MKVLHVVGKEMEEMSPSSEGVYQFYDGDVYVVDGGNEIFIWIGKDCSVDEKTVGAWVANKIDNEERGGEPRVQTMVQGEEDDAFRSKVSFTVLDGDTPGFLRHAELDTVEYKLFRVFIKTDTASLDDAEVEEVKMDKKSLNSDDVFVLDGNENLFMFVGKNAQREEKYHGQKLLQKIDSSRNYLPISYTIYEGEGGKSENAFYEMIEKAKKTKGPVVSVEDQRELSYKPEDYETAEEHKEKVEKEMKKSEKKGFWARLFGIFR